MFISRALAPVECRYIQVKKEASCLDLGVCERCHDYILGKSIITETGHKPIVPFLTKHNLHDVPPRIQCHRMQLM